MNDDREEFRRQIHDHAARLAADPHLRRQALEVFAAADRHHFSYLWSWLGLPIIQMPDDIVLLQEIIWDRRPHVVIETGVARGGSVVLSASILELLGEGRVIGIDVDVRPHNRQSLERHPLSHRITLIEGSSIDRPVVEEVRRLIPERARVMAILDSDHTHEHVLAELHAYGALVTEGQFLVVADTILESIPAQTHRPRRWGPGNNPATALAEYLRTTDRFLPDPWYNNRALFSSSPGGYLRCIKP